MLRIHQDSTLSNMYIVHIY